MANLLILAQALRMQDRAAREILVLAVSVYRAHRLVQESRRGLDSCSLGPRQAFVQARLPELVVRIGPLG